MWDVAAGKEVRRIGKEHGAQVWTVAFSPDGQQALSGGGAQGNAAQRLHLCDVTTGKELRTFVGHTGNVRCVAFSPDGRHALSAGTDATVRLWRLAP